MPSPDPYEPMARPPTSTPEPPAVVPLAGLGRAVGKTRYVVLVAVAAVLLISLTLFLLGAAEGIQITVEAWHAAFSRHEFASTDLTVKFLAVISTMLKAVVMYLVGVGLYSLFIEPLNLTAALGVESLVDLETKVVSIVVVILGVTFLQHFIHWKEPMETLQFGGALALAVAALVLFQWNSRQGKQFTKEHSPNEQKRAAGELFHADREERTVRADEVEETAKPDDR
ncbi:MAG TPA: YqhA family protein [Geminicoccus sp.]|jgi:uncharacterized membrane protein YqhA|uniref:YqhA family protein n=1 Tax=Geminicoccus sp. TaxID=2024832 RepID=UPI002E35C32F|nr:YqhA family protein [Geminicoccus sp.]HEX2524796.1 YqhA family protein [Geminicoccus sp.]